MRAGGRDATEVAVREEQEDGLPVSLGKLLHHLQDGSMFGQRVRRNARRSELRGQPVEIERSGSRQPAPPALAGRRRQQHPVRLPERLGETVLEDGAAGGEGTGFEDRHEARAGPALGRCLEDRLDRGWVVGEVPHHQHPSIRARGELLQPALHS